MAKTMSGARAKFGIYNPLKNTVEFKGTVSQITFGLTYDFQAAFILGRFSAASIQHTAVEVVTINANGWRNFGHGAHQEMELPQVQDMLLYEPIVLIVSDREAEARGLAETRVAVIHSVLPVAFAGGFVSKNLSEMSTTYVGILVDDENVKNFEHPTAMQFPA